MRKFSTQVAVYSLMLFVTLFMGNFSVYAQTGTTGATVKTDLQDYPPGATVNITGSGFGSGENVTLQVVHVGEAPGGTDSQYHLPWTVTAMANGTFTATWRVP